MKALLFFLITILAFFILPSLFGSILADRKSKGNDYFQKIIIPLGYGSFILLGIFVGVFIHFSGGYLNHTMLEFEEGIFVPFTIASGCSFFMNLLYRVKFISKNQKEKDLFFLTLPSLALFLLSFISIYELLIT